MTKPVFGTALGEHTDHAELPDPLRELFGRLLDA